MQPLTLKVRALIRFLEGLLSGDTVHDALFFPNGGRHLYFPMSFFEEAVQLLMDLPSFTLEVGLDTYQEVFFQELQEDSGLFSFQVVEMRSLSNYRSKWLPIKWWKVAFFWQMAIFIKYHRFKRF